MIVSMTLGLEWGLDKMMTLAEQSIHDFDMKEEILNDIDFEHVELLLDSWAGFASRRNWGGSSTLDCKTQKMACWTAFENY
jgi:hypothetical protein